jgi:hypothetical protein
MATHDNRAEVIRTIGSKEEKGVTELERTAKSLGLMEVTTKIGCPNNCLKYCPQEVTVRNYKDPTKILTLEAFRKACETLPEKLEVRFSGFSEPFSSPECAEMIDYAFQSGFRVSVFTTLIGMTEEDVKKILRHKDNFEVFCIHIPDGKVFSKPITDDYKDRYFQIIQGVSVATSMLMNKSFRTNNRENVVRGLYAKRKRFGYCPNLREPQFEMLPNLDLYLCCMDFGLWHKMGNLYETPYPAIRERYLRSHKDFNLCHLCSNYIVYPDLIPNRLLTSLLTSFSR